MHTLSIRSFAAHLARGWVAAALAATLLSCNKAPPPPVEELSQALCGDGLSCAGISDCKCVAPACSTVNCCLVGTSGVQMCCNPAPQQNTDGHVCKLDTDCCTGHCDTHVNPKVCCSWTATATTAAEPCLNEGDCCSAADFGSLHSLLCQITANDNKGNPTAGYCCLGLGETSRAAGADCCSGKVDGNNRCTTSPPSACGCANAGTCTAPETCSKESFGPHNCCCLNDSRTSACTLDTDCCLEGCDPVAKACCTADWTNCPSNGSVCCDSNATCTKGNPCCVADYSGCTASAQCCNKTCDILKTHTCCVPHGNTPGCDTEGCCDPLDGCNLFLTPHSCCRADGKACGAPSDCCFNDCGTTGTCCVNDNNLCHAGTTQCCVPNETCGATSNTCCMPDGQACPQGTTCCAGDCNGGFCCVPQSHSCTPGTSTCCGTNAICGTVQGTPNECCMPPGTTPSSLCTVRAGDVCCMDGTGVPTCQTSSLVGGTQTFCCITTGNACGTGGDATCCSGDCDNGKCVAPSTSAAGGPCVDSADCAGHAGAGLCCAGSTDARCSTSTPAGQCCLPDGIVNGGESANDPNAQCTGDTQCCHSGSHCVTDMFRGVKYCAPSVCEPSASPAHACGSTADCCCPLPCSNNNGIGYWPQGHCCLPPGTAQCTSDTDCCGVARSTAICDAGTCQLPLNVTCDRNIECTTDFCNTTGQCATPGSCILPGSATACTTASDCCTEAGQTIGCNGSACCNPAGSYCGSLADCCAGLECDTLTKECLKSPGMACAPPGGPDSSCVSGLCFQDHTCNPPGSWCCAPSPGTVNQCFSSGDCRGAVTVCDQVPRHDDGGAPFCCLPAGSGCRSSGDCCWDQCASIQCSVSDVGAPSKCCNSVNQSCFAGTDCCSGTCTESSCACNSVAGNPCFGDGDCCSPLLVCNEDAGVCAATVGSLKPCTDHDDCSGANVCVGAAGSKVCCLGVVGSCTSETATSCCSGVCGVNKCLASGLGGRCTINGDCNFQNSACDGGFCCYASGTTCTSATAGSCCSGVCGATKKCG